MICLIVHEHWQWFNPDDSGTVMVLLEILKFYFKILHLLGNNDNHWKFFMYWFLEQIWDARSNDGVKRTIHGPHICGDSLDLKVVPPPCWITRAREKWHFSTWHWSQQTLILSYNLKCWNLSILRKLCISSDMQ